MADWLRNLFFKEKHKFRRVEYKLKKEENTVFHKLLRLKRHHQLIFSVVIIFAVVLVWRGAWNLVDRYWFPWIPEISELSGILVGVLLLAVAHKAVYILAGE